MDYSYQAIYAGYVKYCGMIAQQPLSFEDWMLGREAPVKTPEDRVREFMSSCQTEDRQFGPKEADLSLLEVSSKF